MSRTKEPSSHLIKDSREFQTRENLHKISVIIPEFQVLQASRIYPMSCVALCLQNHYKNTNILLQSGSATLVTIQSQMILYIILNIIYYECLCVNVFPNELCAIKCVLYVYTQMSSMSCVSQVIIIYKCIPIVILNGKCVHSKCVAQQCIYSKCGACIPNEVFSMHLK